MTFQWTEDREFIRAAGTLTVTLPDYPVLVAQACLLVACLGGVGRWFIHLKGSECTQKPFTSLLILPTAFRAEHGNNPTPHLHPTPHPRCNKWVCWTMLQEHISKHSRVPAVPGDPEAVSGGRVLLAVQDGGDATWEMFASQFEPQSLQLLKAQKIKLCKT